MDSADQEPLLREALTLQGPRAWRRFSRVMSAWESLSDEYARREAFLANSRVKKVGFTITRVPR